MFCGHFGEDIEVKWDLLHSMFLAVVVVCSLEPGISNIRDSPPYLAVSVCTSLVPFTHCIQE